MNRFYYAISVLLFLFAVSACDADDPSTPYEKVRLSVGEISLSTSLNDQQRQTITQLIDNMVKVESCQFYMGAQSYLATRANYSGNFSSNVDSMKITEVTDQYGYLHTIKNNAYVDYLHILDKKAYRHTMGNGVVKVDTIRFLLIHKMPTSTGTDNGHLWVGPVTEMNMPNDYYIGTYEVTQAQWMAVMGQWPSGRQCIDANTRQDSAWYCRVGLGDNYPAYNVWYEDAVAFCNRLNQLCNMPNSQGYSFRLPTEAEWECAARGGRYSRGFKYPGSDDYTQVAWCAYNAYSQEIGYENYGMHPGGELEPNELGLYDMAGNVSEWVGNTYYRYTYRDSIASPEFNAKHQPLHSSQGYVGDTLILRGGSWYQPNSSSFDNSARQEYTHGTIDPQRVQNLILHSGLRIVLAK